MAHQKTTKDTTAHEVAFVSYVLLLSSRIFATQLEFGRAFNANGVTFRSPGCVLATLG
jgi:hypothetical protein